MFSRSNKLTTLPSSIQPSSSISQEESILIDEMKKKQSLINMLRYITHIPGLNEYDNHSSNVITKYINKTIKVCVNNINESQETISRIKVEIHKRNIQDAYDKQMKVINDILDNYCSLPEDSDDIIRKAKNLFKSPESLDELFNNKQIIEIANEIYNYIESKYPLRFIQASPFLKELYIKCIKALVICLPFHDMVNCACYNEAFDYDIIAITNHIRLLFNEVITKSSAITDDEWNYGNSGYNIKIPSIPFDDECIDNYLPFLYPQQNSEDTVTTRCKYSISMVMIEIYTIIFKLYK